MRVRQVGGGQVAVVRPASGGFVRHSHDEYVISVNLRGRERVRLDRASFEAGVEEVTVYNPGQVQSCTTSTPYGLAYSCASWYVPPDLVRALTGEASVDFARPVLRSPHLRARLLAAIGSALSASTDPDLVDERLVVVLLGLLDRAGTPRATAGPAPGDARVIRVLDRLRSDLSGAPRLADLAAELGVSREHLIRTFTRATGSPPYAWHLQARLAEGRRRLRRGAEVATVAHDLGFADQAHFHRHFTAAYAITPGRFRRLSGGGAVAAGVNIRQDPRRTGAGR